MIGHTCGEREGGSCVCTWGRSVPGAVIDVEGWQERRLMCAVTLTTSGGEEEGALSGSIPCINIGSKSMIMKVTLLWVSVSSTERISNEGVWKKMLEMGTKADQGMSWKEEELIVEVVWGPSLMALRDNCLGCVEEATCMWLVALRQWTVDF